MLVEMAEDASVLDGSSVDVKRQTVFFVPSSTPLTFVAFRG